MHSDAEGLHAHFENGEDGNVSSESSQGDCEDAEEGEKHAGDYRPLGV